MNFNTINMDTWKRKDVFAHFISDVKCVISITVDMDVTNLVKVCKERPYKFYPTYMYLVSTIVNRHEEFRMGYGENGEAGIWDSVSPSYVVFHPDDQLFTRLITEYTPDFSLFHQRTLDEMEAQEDKRALEVPYSMKNTFDISCLPWISYKSLDLHVYDSGTYLAPVITWGKFEEKNDAFTMPLSLQIHHAAADGFHVARFFSEVQAETEQFACSLMQEIH